MHFIVLCLGVLSSAYLGECTISSWTSPVQAGTGGEITAAILTLPEGYTGDFITFAAVTDMSPIAYTMTQTPADIFEIATEATGVLTLASGEVLDYETAQTHVLIVTATDNTAVTPAVGSVTVTIVITNVAPAFTFTTQSIEVADATAASAAIATIAATDTTATITYAITAASNTNTDFAISPVGGAVTTAKVLAAGTTSTYALVITAADNVATIMTGTTTLVVCVGTCPSSCSGSAGLAAGVLSLITLAMAMLK